METLGGNVEHATHESAEAGHAAALRGEVSFETVAMGGLCPAFKGKSESELNSMREIHEAAKRGDIDAIRQMAGRAAMKQKEAQTLSSNPAEVSRKDVLHKIASETDKPKTTARKAETTKDEEKTATSSETVTLTTEASTQELKTEHPSLLVNILQSKLIKNLSPIGTMVATATEKMARPTTEEQMVIPPKASSFEALLADVVTEKEPSPSRLAEPIEEPLYDELLATAITDLSREKRNEDQVVAGIEPNSMVFQKVEREVMTDAPLEGVFAAMIEQLRQDADADLEDTITTTFESSKQEDTPIITMADETTQASTEPIRIAERDIDTEREAMPDSLYEDFIARLEIFADTSDEQPQALHDTSAEYLGSAPSNARSETDEQLYSIEKPTQDTPEMTTVALLVNALKAVEPEKKATVMEVVQTTVELTQEIQQLEAVHVDETYLAIVESELEEAIHELLEELAITHDEASVQEVVMALYSIGFVEAKIAVDFSRKGVREAMVKTARSSGGTSRAATYDDARYLSLGRMIIELYALQVEQADFDRQVGNILTASMAVVTDMRQSVTLPI